MTAGSLEIFHPVIRKWFKEKVGEPTEIQSNSWPVIAEGKHVLITAPTGSGKTLTAFLWAINQFITGDYQTGKTRVLYISPLKALNNDIRRNLLKPLSEINDYYKKEGLVFEGMTGGMAFPEIRVAVRSGDTTAEERRRMLRNPPEILITTPESLNILLSSKNSRLILNGIAVVILDEIHALIGDKRGTHLITAVDRLIPLCGEFQRIALSATVNPLQPVADFIGGNIAAGHGDDARYSKRKVAIIHSETIKQYRIQISFPEEAREKMTDDSWWPVLAEEFKKIIFKNKSTLLFTNSRRTAEKVTRLINENEAEIIAYSHHGSISKELRLAVEEKLKNGELRAIVATNSLELGIDIGELDEVILVQTPNSISSAIQKVGRSGHGVGETSSGKLFPTHGRDFLGAAVISKCIIEHDIEPIRPVECPLDVLAQILISITGVEEWDIDELYSFIKTSYPYRNLSRIQFDLVLNMLAGKYADTRLRELRPRVSIDKLENKIRAKEGALYILYTSGGTIPDRGYFDMRIQDTKAKIGELDEEFVWERKIGDTFALGAQVWRIQKFTPNDVEVVPVKTQPGIFPFWKAEELNNDFYFSEKIGLFLEEAEIKIADPESFKDEIIRNYYFQETAADELIGFLTHQKLMTAARLPGRYHILIEHFEDPQNRSDRKQAVIHTLWGGKVNLPFSLALSAAWEEKYNYPLEVMSNNDSIVLMLPHQFKPIDLFNLVTPENIEQLLRLKLENTGFFGSKFRENAGRALLLPKSDFKKRLPLWLNRLRSKKLLESVSRYPDFPILLETWRNCLQDEFDLDHLKQLLDETGRGMIEISECITSSPSPFCDSLVWKQTNKYMYEDDTPSTGKGSNLSDDLMRDILYSSRLRPKIPQHLVQILEEKLQRTAKDYAPSNPGDLLDWVKERLLIPEGEWKVLLGVMERDYEIKTEEILSQLLEKLILVNIPGAKEPLICALENLYLISNIYLIPLEKIEFTSIIPGRYTFSKKYLILKISKKNSMKDNNLDDNGRTELLVQWLSYYGPVEVSRVKETLGLPDSLFEPALETMVESRAIVMDQLLEGSFSLELCESENLERLLRMARLERQPAFQALGQEYLPLFLAAYQGLIRPEDSIEGLQKILEQLFGYPASAETWEESIFPARLRPYFTSWLDSLMQSSELLWFGCGKEKLSFAFSGELDLYMERNQKEKSNLFPDTKGKYGLLDISHYSGLDTQTAAEKLWKLAWQGRVTNDTFQVIRQGILNRFTSSKIKEKQQNIRRGFSSSRSGMSRWSASRPLSGGWYIPENSKDSGFTDIIEEEEMIKDRVRQLFLRYGVLFREILAKEPPLMQWGKIFRNLRLMELSGEIMSGYFFEGISGLQFISQEAFRFLQNNQIEKNQIFEDSIFWINAVDPASLCGVMEGKDRLPRRISSNHIVYHGRNIVLISQKNGRNLEFHVPPGHPRIKEYLSFFKILLTREFNPLSSIKVETINGIKAKDSEYKTDLKTLGFTAGYQGLELWKKY